MKQNKPVLLIVDDVPLNTHILSLILKKDYQIKVANSGYDALIQAKQIPLPDLILLDVKMPDMNGYQVMEQLKENVQTDDIPVIFITGSDTIKDEERGLSMGAVDYITKPIRSVIVKARVKIHIVLKYQRDKLLHYALHDQLTGLYNRYHFESEGNIKFSRAKRQNNKLSVVMIDIDDFKFVNDNHGHFYGDRVLESVAKLLSENNRIEDFTARYGGEEFIIVLEDCSADDAKIKAEVLRKSIENLNPEKIKISASFGVSELKDTHEFFEDLLKEADEALYEAKESGKNKVVIKGAKLLS